VVGGDKMQKKLDYLSKALEALQNDIDKATTPWEAERLESLWTKLWHEYHSIEKQLKH
jgi:hypothetical protein